MFLVENAVEVIVVTVVSMIVLSLMSITAGVMIAKFKERKYLKIMDEVEKE